MHLVFGMAADGRSYPEIPGTGCGVGAAVVGPEGLLELMAMQMGLSRPSVPALVRVAAWKAKMACACACSPRFWSASLAVDPWSTARHMLGWRDSLVEAGWKPCRAAFAGTPPRLADLAEAEMVGPDLPPGRADRLREIVAAVGRGERGGIAFLELIDREELLPPGWKHLVAALRSAGVDVRPVPSPAHAKAGTDLGMLQRFLVSGHIGSLRGDGTVVEITSGTSLLAAECVAGWIAADPFAGRGTVVVSDGDTTLLDRALARRGLPVMGISSPSPRRGGYQVLALSFAVAWAPLDVGRLLEFLALPISPIPPSAASQLAEALRDEPGMGGAAWRRAWARIEADWPRVAGGEPASREEIEFWLQVGLYERGAGIPTDAAVEICRRLAMWAGTSAEAQFGPLRSGLVEAARNLETALSMLGQATVAAHQLDRMIAQAIEGFPDPASCAEEGGIRAVADPGALWAPADCVVWWGFTGPADRPASCPWDGNELAHLAASGCHPDLPADVQRRDQARWRSVIRQARKTIVFVRPHSDRGDETARHPLAHQLAPLLGTPTGRQAVEVPAEPLLARGNVRIAGRRIERTATDVVVVPSAQAVWELPPTLTARVSGRRESATSIEDMMGCQFRWLLRHVVGLRDRGVAPPDGERLLGNLAHALAHGVFGHGTVPDPDTVRSRARARFDDLVERTAAPLLLPGLSAELAHARQRMPDALAALAGLLRSRRLAIVGTEVDLARDMGGLGLVGRVDMVVSDPAGARAAVDLKWSRSAARRRLELAEGRAVQLAVYDRLLDAAGRAAPSAFFMLRQRLALSTTGSPLATEDVTPFRDLDKTWEAVVADWSALVGFAQRGIGLASGVGGEDLVPGRSMAAHPNPCTSCDLRRLCRVSKSRKDA